MPPILLTNDDGFDAKGLSALASALRPLGDVAISAPDGERSASGAGLTLGSPLRAKPRGELAWAVSGQPVDCVYLAVNGLLPRLPDLLVSGINRGPNLADDVHYSGTVAGAMEGASHGIPSMAVSLAWLSGPEDYSQAAKVAAGLAQEILQKGLPPRVFLNVNVPNLPEVSQGYRWTQLGIREYGRSIESKQDPRGKPYYWIGGHLKHESLPGSDCDAIAAGEVSITPITLDWTARDCLALYRQKGTL